MELTVTNRSRAYPERFDGKDLEGKDDSICGFEGTYQIEIVWAVKEIFTAFLLCRGDRKGFPVSLVTV